MPNGPAGETPTVRLGNRITKNSSVACGIDFSTNGLGWEEKTAIKSSRDDF